MGGQANACNEPQSQVRKIRILCKGTVSFTLIVLISPLLAAGLALSVGCAGGVDRGADASADQVAPAGCYERLRTPGDRPSHPSEVEVTRTLALTGTYQTVDNYYRSL